MTSARKTQILEKLAGWFSPDGKTPRKWEHDHKSGVANIARALIPAARKDRGRKKLALPTLGQYRVERAAGVAPKLTKGKNWRLEPDAKPLIGKVPKRRVVTYTRQQPPVASR